MTVQHITLTPIAVAAAAAEAPGCSGDSCAVGAAPAHQEVAPTGTRREYLVTGMTCNHCVRAVSAHLGALEGVHGVDVHLVAGGASRVSLRTPAELDDAVVHAAIEEAGYQPA